MTPAIRALEKTGVRYRLHTYEHDSSCQAYGDEAVEKLGLEAARVFKTLVAECDEKQLVVAVIPVSKMLDLKALAKEMEAKKARMADKNNVERITGYLLGGVSPIGQKKKLKTIIDQSAGRFATIYISGGRRGLDIELSGQDLGLITGAGFALIGK